ncbi:hypothetical protein ELQ92_03050 [Labedella populi]|uniref:Uncharacterized protein n=1 Tax=Labedella populi TaxID=2498850 RepID=A0A444QFC2_9MICO|nr:hypothetical protein [Labedella populi]RWZ68224.1 hypothetical protein ELQ92_03050 [Labedella populi]
MTISSPRTGRVLRVLLILVGASVVSAAVAMALVGVLRDVLRVACRFTADGEAAGWACADGLPYGFIAVQIGTVLWTFLVAGALAGSFRRVGDDSRPTRRLRVGSWLVTATSGAVLIVFGAALLLQAVELARSCGSTVFSALPVESCSTADVPVGALVWSVMPVWALLLIVETAWASLLRPVEPQPA